MALIRPARLDDARGIAEARVASWRATYRGHVSDAYLERLSVDTNEKMIGENFAKVPGQRWWVAEDGGRIVGFATTGPAEEGDAAEVYAIYLLPETLGKGVGRTLLERAVAELRTQGFKESILWVLTANARARRFYERAGWKTDGATKNCFDGETVPAVRYRVSLA